MKQIPLTQGKVALVSDRDYRWLMQWKWYAYRCRNTFRAQRNVLLPSKHRTIVLMHRQIMGEPEGQVDHRNGDGLNNQRGNLRLATHGENQHNRGMSKNNTSGFKGVHWHRQRGRWQARITINGRMRSIGLFDSPEEAANAYDEAAIHHFGEFARTNKEIRSNAKNHQ